MKNKKDSSGQTQPDGNALFKKLGDIVSSYLEFDTGKAGSPEVSPAAAGTTGMPRFGILAFLKPVPWILAGIFAFSFVWDFEGVSATVAGIELHFGGLLRIISVSGMIGFFTNWIAITMLFRPLKKRPLLGQGLIPAHKKRIAWRLARAVSDDLINPVLIKQKIDESRAISRYRRLAMRHIHNVTSREDFRRDLKQWILEYIDALVHNPEFRQNISAYLLNELEDALRDKTLEKAALKTYSYFRGQTLREFIEEIVRNIPVSAEKNIAFLDEYLDELPSKIDRNSQLIDDLITQGLYKLINQLNVQHLVEENLNRYDEQKLETMIRNATNEQLKTIQYLGAVLGTIGGFVIWEPLWSLAILALLFAGVYLADLLLSADEKETPG